MNSRSRSGARRKVAGALAPCLALAFSAAGCSAPATVGRVPLVAPLVVGPTNPGPSRDQRARAVAAPEVTASRAAVDQSPHATDPDAGVSYRLVGRCSEPPTPPAPEPPSVVPPSTDAAQAAWGPDDGGGYDGDGSPGREPFVPANTVMGTGIGAMIGQLSDHGCEGALIGGGIGLMLDLGRLWR